MLAITPKYMYLDTIHYLVFVFSSNRGHFLHDMGQQRAITGHKEKFSVPTFDFSKEKEIK